MKAYIEYKDAIKLLMLAKELKKETAEVRETLSTLVERVGEFFKLKSGETKDVLEIDVSDNERLAVYRTSVSILSEPEYSQDVFNWAKASCKIFKCYKPLAEKFNLASNIERPEGFKFDEEFELLEHE